MKYSIFLCFLLLGSSFASKILLQNKCDRNVEIVEKRNPNAGEPRAPFILNAGDSTELDYPTPGGFNIRDGQERYITQAEFNFNEWQNHDFYDLSCIDGFNTAMQIIPPPNDVNAPTVTCTYKECPDAYQFPDDNSKNHGIPSTGGQFQLIFCP